jgi:hypothetical protein
MRESDLPSSALVCDMLTDPPLCMESIGGQYALLKDCVGGCCGDEAEWAARRLSIGRGMASLVASP